MFPQDKKKEPVYGADVLRWRMADSDWSSRIHVAPELFAMTNQSILKIRNTFRYLPWQPVWLPGDLRPLSLWWPSTSWPLSPAWVVRVWKSSDQGVWRVRVQRSDTSSNRPYPQQDLFILSGDCKRQVNENVLYCGRSVTVVIISFSIMHNVVQLVQLNCSLWAIQ